MLIILVSSVKFLRKIEIHFEFDFLTTFDNTKLSSIHKSYMQIFND